MDFIGACSTSVRQMKKFMGVYVSYGGGVTHGAEIRAMCGAWGLLRLQTAAPWFFVEVCLCFGPFGPCLQIGI
ncbi:Putative ATP-dependent helicase IRC3 [Gossypium arboreum]|uniref:Putative ATP-dependent helicase IRC3 n=1 Tax=Gossypium arboreum TaxID=29729 RepID=A0A0B0NR54_GOSAR|nr:Putative ATP-dependent helicase IRC3 [Gossypium arboreum]